MISRRRSTRRWGSLASAACQRPGELAYGFLMLLVSDLGKVAGDLQQHALVGRDLLRPFFADALVKISNRSAQRARNLEQPSSRDAIDAALVFVGLLISHPDHLGELLLGQAQHDAAFADPASHMVVDRGGRPPSLRFGHGFHLCNYSPTC